MPGTDKRDLHEALRTIRESVPNAVSVDFRTSDQDTYGFVLVDVNLADGTFLNDVDEDRLGRLSDDVEQYINDISWNGVMGEDRGGSVTIDLPPASEFTDEELAENTYMSDLLALVDAFNYERCGECGNDLNKHSIGPDPLGKPHLFCLATEAPASVG
jgi:hypothetical protein